MDKFQLTVGELMKLLEHLKPEARVRWAWAGGISDEISDTFYLDTRSGALIIHDGTATYPEVENGEWKLLK